MKCHVYRSERKSGTYLYLAQHDDFSAVPEAVLKPLGQLVFALSFELNAERGLAKEDPQVVMHNLQQSGFHRQMPDHLDEQASRVRQANSKLH